MIGETVLVFEYTPAIEECPECGIGVYLEVVTDSNGQAFRHWACEDCEWCEPMGDWIRISFEDYWDWLCCPALSDERGWELKTRRVVKE